MEYHGFETEEEKSVSKYENFKNYLKKKPDNKFNIFVSLILGFYKELNQVRTGEAAIYEKAVQRRADTDRENKIEELKEELRKEVDIFIEHKDKNKLEFILKRGYELTTPQCIELMRSEGEFSSDIIKGSIDYKLSHNYIVDVIETFNSLHKYEDPEHKIYHYYTKQEYFNAIQGNVIGAAHMAQAMWSRVDMTGILADDTIALAFLESCRHMKTMCAEHKFSGRIDFEASLDKFISDIEKDKSDVIEDKFNQKMDKYSVILNQSFDNMKEGIVKDIITNVRNFKEKDIPKESLEIIQSIRGMHQNIASGKFDIQTELELETLYKKRLPQVIEEYMTISPHYRKKLVEHNESPDKLLLDSLTQVHTKIQSIYESLEEKNINKMKVTNRYLKKL